jgi:glycosyltransferase involved in cell wall biosynthesis
MLTFCSIVTPATRAQARVMAESARRHHPGARVIALFDGRGGASGSEPFEQADLQRGASIAELLRHALQRADTAVYLDPEVWVCDSLAPLIEAACEHGVAVVPRAVALPDDDRHPDYSDLLGAGEISPALLAVHRGEPSAEFLEWWSRRERPEVSEGRWLALAAGRFPFIATVADPGCNVSYWNLHERPLGRTDGRVTAAGRPLRSIHFSGFRPDRPYWLSEQADRVRVIDDPVLSELCGEYAETVREAGWRPPRRQLGGVERLGNGQRVDHLVRSLWEEALDAGFYFGDPMAAAAADEFVSWIREPAARGGSSGVNRYLLAAYVTRPDLQQAFPDLDSASGAGLVDWAWHHGRQEVFSELLPTPTDWEAAAEALPLAVNVIGYLGETLGLAEAARLYVASLNAAGVPVNTTAIKPDLPLQGSRKATTRYGSSTYKDLRASAEPTFNLACLNGDHLAELVRVNGEEVLHDRPTIGQWGWETDVLPPSWADAYRVVDEVWVYSKFMAENLGRLLPMPVVVVPPAIVAPDPAGAELPIPCDDRFTFVFMLDFFSTLRRKNPLGLVEAFTRAFAPGEGPRLIIKTINAQFREQAADELRFRVGQRRDVEFFDGYFDQGQKAALLARADCYVSLHRSEGFGLPLAESMALGTPVIATGYSGNLDFTTPHNSYLVDWAPTRVGPDCEIYPAHGTWAEPDLEHAAKLMRYVWEHQAEAAAKGARARVEINQRYAPAVTGAIARGRLERLLDARTTLSSRSSDSSESLARVQQAIAAFDLRRGALPVPTGPTGLLRRLVLRLLLPYTYHEREVDQGLVLAMSDLRAELDTEREHRRRATSRRRRLETGVENMEELVWSNTPPQQ